MRTLLLAEDTGFYGHRGIDLRGSARGASTITQQLAKNLFLSRDKQLGPKLQELAITFLLESGRPISEFIRARHAGARAAFADRRAAGEAAVVVGRSPPG